jgi:hypothetical protein
VSTYPVTFEADYVERRSRLTTFFRLLLVIPQAIVLGLYGFVVVFAVIAAWFALLFTGRWPESLYAFTAGYLRYYARVMAYTYLLVDPYPPFSADEEPSYPVRMNVAPPLAQYSRLKVALRIFYVIPAAIIVYVLNLVAEIVGFVAWLVIVVTGKQPPGLQDGLNMCISYMARAQGLFLLVTETYPPFTDERPGRVEGPPAPAAPLPAAPEAPASVQPPAPVEQEEPPPPA